MQEIMTIEQQKELVMYKLISEARMYKVHRIYNDRRGMSRVQREIRKLGVQYRRLSGAKI